MDSERQAIRSCFGLGGPGGVLQIGVAAANPVTAEALGRAFRAEGACGLVSFGVAGACRPDLRSGDILLPPHVLTNDGTRFETDQTWHNEARSRIARAELGSRVIADSPLLGVDHPLASLTAKAQAFSRFGVGGVDMESHGVARAAHDTFNDKSGGGSSPATPFLVIRIVLDAADRSIPEAALHGMGPNGETRLLPVLLAVMKKPRQLPGLLHLARANTVAMNSLRSVARALGPDFGFPLI